MAAMIDLEPAFDKIPHTSILLQLIKLNIRGRLPQFTDNFLQERAIQTKVNHTISTKARVHNGIPQESVLSPTLFNIALHNINKD
jgi:retron-type reverse transcriptase